MLLFQRNFRRQAFPATHFNGRVEAAGLRLEAARNAERGNQNPERGTDNPPTDARRFPFRNPKSAIRNVLFPPRFGRPPAVSQCSAVLCDLCDLCVETTRKFRRQAFPGEKGDRKKGTCYFFRGTFADRHFRRHASTAGLSLETAGRERRFAACHGIVPAHRDEAGSAAIRHSDPPLAGKFRI